MIMRRFDNFGTCTPILNVNAEALVRFGALWAWVQPNESNITSPSSLICTANLMVEIVKMMNFVALRCAVGRSETTESRRIHLLL